MPHLKKSDSRLRPENSRGHCVAGSESSLKVQLGRAAPVVTHLTGQWQVLPWELRPRSKFEAVTVHKTKTALELTD